MAHDLARKRPRSGPKSLKRSGAQGRNRTTDTRIFSPLLYRLSYLGSWGVRYIEAREGTVQPAPAARSSVIGALGAPPTKRAGPSGTGSLQARVDLEDQLAGVGVRDHQL